MSINYDNLIKLNIPVIEHTYTIKDTILYALAIGVGFDPTDSNQLQFVYERDLHVLPTQAVVLAHPGPWLSYLDTGVDYAKVVHGEQGLTIHKPLPPAATVLGVTRVTSIVDKGTGRGALVYSQREIFHKGTGDLLATTSMCTFCRGDGGFGGASARGSQLHMVPEREADIVCELPSLPQAALLYRLTADLNPLHSDPDVAAQAGFSRPILHGLATYGLAGHAVIKSVCGYNASTLMEFDCRFTAPVFPGETFQTEIWVDGDIASFRTRSVERDVIAISNGRAKITS